MIGVLGVIAGILIVMVLISIGFAIYFATHYFIEVPIMAITGKKSFIDEGDVEDASFWVRWIAGIMMVAAWVSRGLGWSINGTWYGDYFGGIHHFIKKRTVGDSCSIYWECSGSDALRDWFVISIVSLLVSLCIGMVLVVIFALIFPRRNVG